MPRSSLILAATLILAASQARAFKCGPGCAPRDYVAGWAAEEEAPVFTPALACPRAADGRPAKNVPNDPYRAEKCERPYGGDWAFNDPRIAARDYGEAVKDRKDAAEVARGLKAIAEITAFYQSAARAANAVLEEQGKVPNEIFQTIGGLQGADPYKAPPLALKRCVLVRKKLEAARARLAGVKAPTLASFVPGFNKEVLARYDRDASAIVRELRKVEELARTASALSAGRSRADFEKSLAGKGIVEIYGAAKSKSLASLQGMASGDAARIEKAFDGSAAAPAMAPLPVPMSPEARLRAEAAVRANIALINDRCSKLDAELPGGREKDELREMWALALEKQYLDLKDLGSYGVSDRAQALLADARMLNPKPEDIGVAALSLAIKNPIVSELLFPGPLYAGTPKFQMNLLQRLKSAVAAGTVTQELAGALKVKAYRASTTVENMRPKMTDLLKRSPRTWTAEERAMEAVWKDASRRQRFYAEVMETLKKPGAAAASEEVLVGAKAMRNIDEIALEGASNVKEVDRLTRLADKGQGGIRKTPQGVLNDYLAVSVEKDLSSLDKRQFKDLIKNMSNEQRAEALKYLEGLAETARRQGLGNDYASRLEALKPLLVAVRK